MIIVNLGIVVLYEGDSVNYVCVLGGGGGGGGGGHRVLLL